ncbi:MAG: hypothetical protein OXU20_33720 [Myxococcales bacterium]|nr:hypothetical protein [Myxococcales bacterium]
MRLLEGVPPHFAPRSEVELCDGTTLTHHESRTQGPDFGGRRPPPQTERIAVEDGDLPVRPPNDHPFQGGQAAREVTRPASKDLPGVAVESGQAAVGLGKHHLSTGQKDVAGDTHQHLVVVAQRRFPDAEDRQGHQHPGPGPPRRSSVPAHRDLHAPRQGTLTPGS